VRCGPRRSAAFLYDEETHADTATHARTHTPTTQRCAHRER
jgi:hypothetical protein